jgi:NifU-like protein involved in Fe-S cluster formation
MKAGQDWIYSEKVKENFINPRNFLFGDESKFDADATGIVGNPICGDQMKMYIKVDSKTDKIKDIRWKTYGCASAIASTSALSELAKGKTLDEALKITAKDIDDYLGNLPKHKFHCSVLGHEALAEAVKNYREEEK